MSEKGRVQSPESEPINGALRQAVLDVFRIAERAAAQVPEERRNADAERRPTVRAYMQGLVDGMEEAQKHFLAPLIAWAEAHSEASDA